MTRDGLDGERDAHHALPGARGPAEDATDMHPPQGLALVLPQQVRHQKPSISKAV